MSTHKEQQQVRQLWNDAATSSSRPLKQQIQIQMVLTSPTKTTRATFATERQTTTNHELFSIETDVNAQLHRIYERGMTQIVAVVEDKERSQRVY
jgi:hypothetical protein